MNVRVLGCSGSISQGCHTTAFLVGEDILVDAGTGVGELTLDALCKVDHVLLTHAHMDHIAALPLMVDAVASCRYTPLQVHALPETLTALQQHVFNGAIWPDFTRIPCPDKPLLSLHPVTVGQTLTLSDKQIEVLPAVHSVPAVGYAINQPGGPSWVFTGDTERNPAFWIRINQMDVAALVIETAFSNREAALARRSLHLSPQVLADELGQIAPDKHFPIYITHTKPLEARQIMAEIARFDQSSTRHVAHDIRWLQSGQDLEI